MSEIFVGNVPSAGSNDDESVEQHIRKDHPTYRERQLLIEIDRLREAVSLGAVEYRVNQEQIQQLESDLAAARQQASMGWAQETQQRNWAEHWKGMYEALELQNAALVAALEVMVHREVIEHECDAGGIRCDCMTCQRTLNPLLTKIADLKGSR